VTSTPSLDHPQDTSQMNFKERVKHSAPAPIKYVLKRVYQYWLRMRDWIYVLREVRGETPADTFKLLASAAASPFTSMAMLGRWQYPKLLFDTNVRVLKNMRFSCRAFTDQLFQVTPSAQRDVTQVIRERLTEGQTFVDAGANIGFFTVLAARTVGTTGQVLSVEMMPETARTLRHHIEVNQLTNVTVVELALSDRCDDVLIARQPVGSAGQASVAAGLQSGTDYIESEVRTITLDKACAALAKIDLMKVDLEGQEATAFLGGMELWPRVRAVVFEYWPEDAGAERAAGILVQAGFSLAKRYSYNVLALSPEASEA